MVDWRRTHTVCHAPRPDSSKIVQDGLSPKRKAKPVGVRREATVVVNITHSAGVLRRWSYEASTIAFYGNADEASTISFYGNADAP